jgi:hypothetical protein
MKSLGNKLVALLDVKSIVTIILTLIFGYLSYQDKISSDQFLMVFTMVISFYFGVQTEKKTSSRTTSDIVSSEPAVKTTKIK